MCGECGAQSVTLSSAHGGGHAQRPVAGRLPEPSPCSRTERWGNGRRGGGPHANYGTK